MDDDDASDTTLFAGLQSLVASAFPKQCKMCGRIYHSPQDFAVRTDAISGRVGFKATVEEDGSLILELFRNCECGSTLMDVFRDRRDTSAAGLLRRQNFEQLLQKLHAKGIPRDVARRELLKVMRGHTSELLDQLVRRGRKNG